MLFGSLLEKWLLFQGWRSWFSHGLSVVSEDNWASGTVPPNLQAGTTDVLGHIISTLEKKWGETGPGFFESLRKKPGCLCRGQCCCLLCSWLGTALPALKLIKASAHYSSVVFDKVINQSLS